jgi:hypothetical protein
VTARLLLLSYVAALACAVGFGVRQVDAARAGPWHRVTTTAYSPRENLTGCTAPGVCHTACGTLLDDGLFTVAANPSLGLACFTHIRVCDPWPRWRCRRAVVTDRTASRFGMEFSYGLSLAVWQDARCWDCVHTAIWRRGW